MRLIDADAIHWWKGEDENGNPIYILDKRDIDKEPTAYSVDKVVEELEEAKTINVNVGYGTIYKTIRKDVAIEIVKQGSVVKVVE